MNELRKDKIIIAICLSILGGFVFIIFFYPASIRWQNKVFSVPVVAINSALTGLPVDSADKTYPQVVGVMVDNFPGIGGQSGLNFASVVYEAPVEGGLTRFLAIFDQAQIVEKVGPVRSARAYFLDWIKEYNALYLHCGGSPEALNLIKTEDIFDANEFYWGKYYWRDNNLSAPHNLFTDSQNWQNIWSEFGADKKITWLGWKFGELNASSSELASSLALTYDGGYEVFWQYNSEFKKYERKLSAKETVLADNVLVLYMKTKIVDDYGRLEINTVGEGDARVLRDGKFIRATWKKESANSRTRFYQNDVELNLQPGVTWLQIASVNAAVKITN